MIEHLIDLAKLVIGVTVGSVIGSYIFEWRIRRIIKRELPKIIEKTAAKAKIQMTEEQKKEIIEKLKKEQGLSRQTDKE